MTRKETAKKAVARKGAARKGAAKKKAEARAQPDRGDGPGAETPPPVGKPDGTRATGGRSTEPEAPPEREYGFELDPVTNRFRSIETVSRFKEPGERRNRGMSHPEAGRVRLAAAVTVLAPAACVVTVIVLIGALVMARFYGEHFDWTLSLLLLVFPAALVLYLTLGAKVRCRLCGQRLLVPRHCLKHERAKRSIFGYTYAVARDALLRANYRCMLCGTKTRLKD